MTVRRLVHVSVLAVGVGALVGTVTPRGPVTAEAGQNTVRSTVSSTPMSSASRIVQVPGFRINGNSVEPFVDGSIDPSAIPDELAYKLFITSTLLKHDSEIGSRLRRSRVERIGMSAADRDDFLQIVNVAGATITRNDAQRAEWRKNAGTQVNPLLLDELKQQDDQALAEAMRQLDLRLSLIGRVQLDAFIQSDVKRKIKTFKK